MSNKFKEFWKNELGKATNPEDENDIIENNDGGPPYKENPRARTEKLSSEEQTKEDQEFDEAHEEEAKDSAKKAESAEHSPEADEISDEDLEAAGEFYDRNSTKKANHSQIEAEIMKLVENTTLSEDEIIRRVAQKTGASTTEVARMMSALDF